jgi:hypothetical protein
MPEQSKAVKMSCALLGWAADLLTALVVAGVAIYKWWPVALKLTETYGPKESGDIRILGVLVFFALGLVGTTVILGLSLVPVIAIVRLSPAPLRMTTRVVGVALFVVLAYVHRDTLMFMTHNLVYGTLRRYGLAK